MEDTILMIIFFCIMIYTMYKWTKAGIIDDFLTVLKRDIFKIK